MQLINISDRCDIRIKQIKIETFLMTKFVSFMARLLWYCLFIHDSHKCINKCLLESRNNTPRSLHPPPPTGSIISTVPHQQNGPPPNDRPLMIVDRPCLPHLTVCRYLITLMTLMTGRHFVMVDISREWHECVYKYPQIFISISIDFCCFFFTKGHNILQYIVYHACHEHGTVCDCTLPYLYNSTKHDSHNR